MYRKVLLISILIINLAGLINGLRQHETWLIIISAISFGLMFIAAIVELIKFYREERNEPRS